MYNVPKEMKAVRLHGKGFENISIDIVPVPEPDDNELLVKVEAAGVCSSILKLVAQGEEHTFINGRDLKKYPAILGDEGCVRVIKAGKNVSHLYEIGKLYATQPAVDHPPIKHRELYRNNAIGMEKVAIGYSLPGHMSEYMLITQEAIEAKCLIPLPSENIPFFAGALCEPFSCVISAQDRHIHISQETPLSPRVPKLGLLTEGITVVIGAGPMGQMHAEAALRFKPKHLIVVDIVQERLDAIQKNLAQKAEKRNVQLLTVKSAELPDLLNKVSNGRGADDIIAAVGIRNVQVEAQKLLAKGGVLNLFGGLKKGEHIIELDTLRVHYDEIKLVGSSGGSPADVKEALRMAAQNEFEPGKYLDMVGSLDQFPKALELIKNTAVEGKIVLYPSIKSNELIKVKNWTKQDEEAFLAAHVN